MFEVLFYVLKVYLAMEAGYYEKVDELCERYSLEGLPKAQGIYCFVLWSLLLLVCFQDAYNDIFFMLLLQRLRLIWLTNAFCISTIWLWKK